MSGEGACCVFCHPKWVMATAVDAVWELPVCDQCAADPNRKPTLPHNHWPHLRGTAGHQPRATS